MLCPLGGADPVPMPEAADPGVTPFANSSFASLHMALNSAAVNTPAPDLSYLLNITPASKSALASAAFASAGLAPPLLLFSLAAGEDFSDFGDFFDLGEA